MQHKFLTIALLLAFSAGCGSSPSQNTAQTPSEKPAPSQAEKKKPVALPPAPPPEAFSAAEQKPAATLQKTPTGPVSPTPPPGMTIEKADVGSGAKGNYGPGIITTPVSTYFRTQERISFYIQIPEFIREYKFEHDLKGPKTNEEFMEKIIKKNNVHLPDLPPGHKYIYDPKEEQLMVIKPR
ncbi:MAG: hypothetical protein ABSA26_12480 [Thermoguttaceae bacterium]|jgi:hypothetical protein